MPSNVPPIAKHRGAAAPDGGGALYEWDILSHDPILQTGREIVLATRRKRDRVEGWLHIVKDNSPANVALLHRHFKTLGTTLLPRDWAVRAGWGEDDGMFYYLTLAGMSVPLSRWMAEHPGSDETFRLRWVLQSARAARLVLEKPHLGLALNADEASVVCKEGDPWVPPTLQWNKLLPVSRLPSQTLSEAQLAGLEQMMHHIFEGNGWPEPLRNAWVVAAGNPAMEQVRKLEVTVEKLLQAPAGVAHPGPAATTARLEVEPAPISKAFKIITETWGHGHALTPKVPVTPQASGHGHRSYGLWGIGVVVGVLTLLVVAQTVSWFWRASSSEKKLRQVSPAVAESHSPVGTAAPPVQGTQSTSPTTKMPTVSGTPRIEDAATKARRAEEERRQAFVEVAKRGNPKEVLAAATPLLASQPQDQAARAAVRGVLQAELRRFLDAASPLEAGQQPGESPWQVWSDLGFPEARLLHAGHLLSTDPEGAAAIVKQLADSGNAPALTLLGQLHTHGLGVRQSETTAATLYEIAAAKGDRTACYLWAEMLCSGDGVRRNPYAAIPWISEAAEAGDGRAMNLMGNCLLKGNGVKANTAEAAVWFRKAADAGNPKGMANLAVLLINGDGVPQNYAEALALARRGSGQDHAFSTHLLAFCYEKGFGVDRDLATATQHYQRAAALGHGPSKDWCQRHRVPFIPVPPNTAAASLPANRVQ